MASLTGVKDSYLLFARSGDHRFAASVDVLRTAVVIAHERPTRAGVNLVPEFYLSRPQFCRLTLEWTQKCSLNTAGLRVDNPVLPH